MAKIDSGAPGGWASVTLHRDGLAPRGDGYHEEIIMAGKTPKIAEVQVGMEINMYACAKQK